MSQSISRKSVVIAAVVISAFGVGYAVGAQPHIEAGLGLLQNARIEIAAAEPNKGGHRERALGLIDQAIEQIREGIAFAATH
jgi:hypothetical protein